jgi:hypothetical protein
MKIPCYQLMPLQIVYFPEIPPGFVCLTSGSMTLFCRKLLLKNDFTGQGLVGMMLLSPIFLICLVGFFFLLHSRTKGEFL